MRDARRHRRLGIERAAKARDLRRGHLRRKLEAAERDEEKRHPGDRDEEGQKHLGRQAAVGRREHPRVDERLGEADRHEVEGHEGARGDREHRCVARLALAVRDRVTERVVGRVEEVDDQERDERRLLPHPPLAPGGARPDRAGEQSSGAEDDSHVDRDVGANVVDRVAGAQVADRVEGRDDEADQRADRDRHVDVEDLLDEALVRVVWRVEEDHRERRAENDDGGESHDSEGGHRHRG